MTPRFHEYPLLLPARLAFTLRWVAIGIATGGGFGFLLALGAGITLNEALIDIWYEIDGDPLMRSLVPFMFVALVIGVLAWAVLDSLYNWTLGRQLARAAQTTPELVPPGWQRAFLTRTSPLNGASVVLWILFGCGFLFAILIVAIIGETRDDELAFVIDMLVTTVAVVAISLLLVILLRVPARRWAAIVEPAAAVWSRDTLFDTGRAVKSGRGSGSTRLDLGRGYRALRAIAYRTVRIGGFTTLGGAAIGMIGVTMRQPCRRCEQRSYDTFGEALIDNLALIGAGIAAIGILVLVVAGAAHVLTRIVGDSALRAAPEGTRPDASVLIARLEAWSLGETFSILLAGVGTASAVTGLSFRVLGLAIETDLLVGGGVALIALAGILAFVGIGANLRFRDRLRERWSPADAVPTSRRPTRKR